MITTIKIDSETKERLLQLPFAQKGKSFNTILIELIQYFEAHSSEYEERVKKHQEAMQVYDKQSKEYDLLVKKHKEDMDEYHKNNHVWVKLLAWAKTQGFKE